MPGYVINQSLSSEDGDGESGRVPACVLGFLGPYGWMFGLFLLMPAGTILPLILGFGNLQEHNPGWITLF